MPDKCAFDQEHGCSAVFALKTRVEQLERWKESSREFHESFYDWQRAQIARDAQLDEKISNIVANLNKLVSWQEAEQAKHGKFLNGIAEKTVWAICAAVIAFFLAKVGL